MHRLAAARKADAHARDQAAARFLRKNGGHDADPTLIGRWFAADVEEQEADRQHADHERELPDREPGRWARPRIEAPGQFLHRPRRPRRSAADRGAQRANGAASGPAPQRLGVADDLGGAARRPRGSSGGRACGSAPPQLGRGEAAAPPADLEAPLARRMLPVATRILAQSRVDAASFVRGETLPAASVTRTNFGLRLSRRVSSATRRSHGCFGHTGLRGDLAPIRRRGPRSAGTTPIRPGRPRQ